MIIEYHLDSMKYTIDFVFFYTEPGLSLQSCRRIEFSAFRLTGARPVVIMTGI